MASTELDNNNRTRDLIELYVCFYVFSFDYGSCWCILLNTIIGGGQSS